MPDTIPLIVLLLLLGAALVGCVIALLRRRVPVPPPDPGLTLLQQQVTALNEQVARIASQVPKEVGTALTDLMGQLGTRLSENARTVQQASADTGRLITDISHRLGELGTSTQQILELGPDIRGLQQIFQAPKIRGGMGELSLEIMLRQIFPAANFALQYAFSDGDTVDAVVRLPGGMVPIDSKFPLASFRAMLEASSEEQRLKARRGFARDVRRHIDDIADKYIRPGEGTLDFALMYIPAENVYYEVIVREGAASGEEDINAYAVGRRVTPVSPNTLDAYLKAIAYGLMGLRIEERAREILKKLQQLQGDFGLFRDSFDLGQKHLRNAQTAFTEASDRAGRLASQVDQFVQVVDETSQDVPPGGTA